MSIWLEIISRELLMLAVLTALGSGPASLLRHHFELVARFCLAPVLGLATGTGLFTTLEWFWPGQDLRWVVPLACVLSLAVAVTVTKSPARSGRHLPQGEKVPPSAALRSLVQISLVCLVVAIPVTIALGMNHSTGPVAYSVYDATGYIAETDAAQVESIRTAESADAPVTNLVARFYAGYARAPQELDYVPLSAAINPLVGLHSTDTQSDFLLAVLIAGALGMYGAVRHTLRRASWLACFGAVLFAGSFFMQLYFDGSEAAIAGLALLVPFLVVAYTEMHERRVGGLIAAALLLEGLFALYPTLDITLGIVLLLALAFLAVTHFRSTGRSGVPVALGFAASAVLVVGVAALTNLVAFSRDVAYWRSLVHGAYVEPNFPALHFPVLAIPGWVTQTRGLYSFAFGQQSALTDFLPAVIVPIAVALCAIPALKRFRVAWLVLVVVPVALGIGGYQVVHNACGYCEDRSLLPVTPAVVYLVAVGLGLLAVNARAIYRAAALGAVALLAATGGLSAWRSYGEFSTGSYFLSSSVRSVLASAPDKNAVVLLEGFGEGPKAPAEEAFVYEMAVEQTGGRLSLAADDDDRYGLAYLGTAPLAPPIFRPDYTYVLTRIPGVFAGRRLIASAPGIALEQRGPGLSVSLDYGAAVSLMPAGDPQGLAWIIGPLQLVVVGQDRRKVYVTAKFALPDASTVVPSQRGLTRAGAELTACLPTTALGVARVADITLPIEAIRIVSMSASYHKCT